ncbi:MAG TPA: GNAT family N-acetyltransferase [Afipia sp.]
MIIRAATEHDLPAITAIYNEVIATSNAVWMDAPTTVEERSNWARSRQAAGYPVLVAAEGSSILGYGSYGEFRPWPPGYRYTVEHSIFIHAGHRGRGLGRLLLGELIATARAQGKHVMVGGIDGDNAASIRLHERMGFEHVARMNETGRKSSRWVDLIFMQLMLDGAGAARPD